MTHFSELEIIRFIQEFRSPFLDSFFKFFDLFDRQGFFFILIPLIWMGMGWKQGLRLFFILSLHSLTNYVLKGIFISPRPFHLDPTLGIIQVSGLGFPSGTGQTVILVSGLLLQSWKSSWKWFIALSYILLVSFSRIYLGVHFPSDILGGWIVGFFLLLIYTFIFPKIESFLSNVHPVFVFLLSQIIPLCLLLSFNVPLILRISSVTMGIGIGLFFGYICNLFQKPLINPRLFVIRGVTGILMTFISYELISWLLPFSTSIFVFLRYSFVGLCVSLGGHVICRFPLQQKKSQNA